MNKINFIFTSDPQYPWTDVTDNGGSESDDVQQSRSQSLIMAQYNNINDYATQSSSPSVVLINGDITAYGHAWQLNKMTEMMGMLTPPIRWGLGNHDIENNYNDTFLNKAALGMMQAFRRHYNSLDVRNKSWDVDAIRSVYGSSFKGSFSYSWDEGVNFHLIQLQNFPGMSGYVYTENIPASSWTESSTMQWDSNLTWLKNVIENAVKRKKIIIVNVHKPDTWPEDVRKAITELFNKYKVSIKAIFAGHYHKRCGYSEYYTDLLGGFIPVFLSGSASQQTYLIMEHNHNQLHIYLVRNNDWKNKTLIYSAPMTLPYSVGEKYKFLSVLASGKCMQRQTDSSIVLYDNIDSDSQKFTIVSVGSAGEDVCNIQSADLLNEKMSWRSNANITLSMVRTPSIGQGEINWHMEYQKDGSYIISNYFDPEIVVGIKNSETANDTMLTAENRTGGDNQRFTVLPEDVSQPLYITSYVNYQSGVNFEPDKVLSSAAENSSLVLWDKDNGPRQIFILRTAFDIGINIFQIESMNTGYILAWNATTTRDLFLHRNEYKEEHYWHLEPQGDGTYIISNYKNPDLVLDVYDAKSVNGTLIHLWHRNGQNAQRFSLALNPNTPDLPVQETDVVLRTRLDGDKAMIINEADGKLAVGILNLMNHLEHFRLVRDETRGHNIFQIYSTVWDAVLTWFATGEEILLMPNYRTNRQLWRFEECSDGVYTLSSLENSTGTYVMEVENQNAVNGSRIVMRQRKEGSVAQQFEVIKVTIHDGGIVVPVSKVVK